MGFMIHLIHKASSSSSAGYICTFVHSKVQNIQICFGSGWEFYRDWEEYHLAFRHNSSAIYIHTLGWILK